MFARINFVIYTIQTATSARNLLGNIGTKNTNYTGIPLMSCEMILSTCKRTFWNMFRKHRKMSWNFPSHFRDAARKFPRCVWVMSWTHCLQRCKNQSKIWCIVLPGRRSTVHTAVLYTLCLCLISTLTVQQQQLLNLISVLT